MITAPADNIFVRIVNGELPSTEVYSDKQVYCFLDIFPQNPGHTLVVPRNYSPNILNAAPEDVRACVAAARRLMPALMAATGALGVSMVTNLGREAGQMIEYLHFHLIPRHPGDAISYYKLGPEQTPEQLREMAAKIKAALAS